jgi:hypothetical protein
MAAKRIPGLTAISGASTANDDNLVIFDTDANETKRILRSQLAAGLVGDLPYTPAGFIAATTVPTAIAEIASDLAAAGGAALIGNTPAGTVSSGTVQGAINEIVSDLAASSGSSLVGFLQSGTGASARTVQSKLRDIISVLDFGADPSGAADSTSAFNAASSAAAGKPVFVPVGTYAVSGAISGSFYSTGKPTFTGGSVQLAIAGVADFVNNAFYGRDAGRANAPGVPSTVGKQNTFIGAGSGINNTTGYANTMLGFSAGAGITTGSGNTLIGYQTHFNNNRSFVTAVGTDAGFHNDADNNTFLGWHSGFKASGTITGTRCTFLGYQTAQAHTTGDDCTTVGANAGFSTTTGGFNTFVGSSAGSTNTTGANGVAVGYQAGNFDNGGTNTWVGARAGYSNNSGYSNVGVGYLAGFANTTGINQTFVGMQAGRFTNTSDNVTAIGQNAGYNLSGANAYDNTLVGTAALFAATTGFQNTAVGASAGRGLTSGDANTFIGHYAGWVGQTDGVTNSTAIGKGAVTTASNQVSVGNGSVTEFRVPGISFIAGVKYLNSGVLTVATLPAAATAGAGARAFVSDATVTTFASIVAGGGANNVPVYSDGTNWRIG